MDPWHSGSSLLYRLSCFILLKASIGQTTDRTGHSLDTETADIQTQTRRGSRPRWTFWPTDCQLQV